MLGLLRQHARTHKTVGINAGKWPIGRFIASKKLRIIALALVLEYCIGLIQIVNVLIGTTLLRTIKSCFDSSVVPVLVIF